MLNKLMLITLGRSLTENAAWRALARCSVGIALCLVSTMAAAGWDLDNANSSLNFISIKQNAVAESHTFSSLNGHIRDDGAVHVGIDLNSVQTLIDIRDERMRNVLFETGRFPTANVTAQIDPDLLNSLGVGDSVATEVTVNIGLHGAEQSLSAPLVAVGGEGGEVRVFTARPLVVNAADFDLQGGVAALQQLAGLAAISTAVPVSLHLVFLPTNFENQD